MRRFVVVLALVGFTAGAALPLDAQQGTLEFAYFVTVQDENVPDLEEGIREHVQWHRDQGDTWTASIWQAITGTQEYVWITQGHTWGDLDNPGVDPTEDGADWANTGARYTESLTTSIWEVLADVSILPPMGTQPAVAQVFEFSLNPGGEEALAHVLAKYHEAASAVAPGNHFGWNAVLAGPEGTTHFVVVPGGSFADFGVATPEPPEVLTRHYGQTEARALFDMFNEAMTFRQARVWAYRADLSYTP